MALSSERRLDWVLVHDGECQVFYGDGLGNRRVSRRCFQWMQLVVTRTLFSAVMHAAATSMVGAAAELRFTAGVSERSWSVWYGVGHGYACIVEWYFGDRDSSWKRFFTIERTLGRKWRMEPFLYSAFSSS